MATNQAQGTGGVQSRIHEKHQNAMAVGYQVSCPLFRRGWNADNHRFYWFRLMVISLIWFIYDFSSYSFSIFSTQWLLIIQGGNPPLWQTFGWGTVINLFYIPGAIFGAFLSDWIGPRKALTIGVIAQGIVGFIMAGCYSLLDTNAHVAGFVVVYG